MAVHATLEVDFCLLDGCGVFTQPVPTADVAVNSSDGSTRLKSRQSTGYNVAQCHNWRAGTTHVIFEPLDFIARFAALIPKPRVNLTRFHGVFAPNSNHRALITSAGRGKGRKTKTADALTGPTPAERHAAMTWAQRLKRVFNIDITTCHACGATMKVIACIEDPDVIRKILTHRDSIVPATAPIALPKPRAPPQASLFSTI